MATFQIKNFTSIVAGMINHARVTAMAITDFNIGSVFRTILEAVAIEIDQLYQQLFNGLMAAIPVATYNSFNFQFLNAKSARGQIAVTCQSLGVAVTYPAGTVFSSPSAAVTYASTAVVVVPPSTTSVNIPVAASQAGAIGNLAAGVAFTPSPSPLGFVSATNALAFSNGADQETDDERARRFVSYVGTLSRGTVDALEYGATTASLTDANGNVTEQVVFVSVVEIDLLELTLDSNVPPVNVYVHNGVGGTSSALVAQAATVLTGYVDSAGVRVPGWKAAGIPILVEAATEVPINVVATITPQPNHAAADLQPLVLAAISSYMVGLDIAALFEYDEMVVVSKAVPGVGNIVFSAPTADVQSANYQKSMPGTFNWITTGTGVATGAATAMAVG